MPVCYALALVSALAKVCDSVLAGRDAAEKARNAAVAFELAKVAFRVSNAIIALRSEYRYGYTDGVCAAVLWRQYGADTQVALWQLDWAHLEYVDAAAFGDFRQVYLAACEDAGDDANAVAVSDDSAADAGDE